MIILSTPQENGHLKTRTSFERSDGTFKNCRVYAPESRPLKPGDVQKRKPAVSCLFRACLSHRLFHHLLIHFLHILPGTIRDTG